MYLIFIYLAIGLILFSYFEQFRNSASYASWMFLALILIVIGYLIYKTFYKEEAESTVSEGGKEEYCDEKGDGMTSEGPFEEEVDFDTLETSNLDSFNLLTSKGFSLSNGVAPKTKITYESFKKWYKTPEFLQQHSTAMKSAMIIQKRKLLEVKAQQLENLKLLKPKNKNSFLSLLDKMDESKPIETIIESINTLLEELSAKYKKISPDYAYECLSQALTDREHGIDSMVGREDIKDFLALQIYTFAKNPRIFYSVFQNIAIYGDAGVGKTKLAKVIGYVYSKCGVLIRSNVFETTKKNFTTAYVNESARKTSTILMSNLSSVIFIDEAYDLAPPETIYGKGLDHSSEALTELVNFLDKMIGLSLVIVAGYEVPMKERFMTANEGLPRRFPHVIYLKNYNAKELTFILCKFLSSTCKEICFTPTQKDYIYTLLSHVVAQRPDVFKNQAGDMLNLSGSISRTIYGTPDKQWGRDFEDLIVSGMNDFLSSNNIMVKSL